INMLAEKVYVFFWFWLLFVGLLTVCSLAYWAVIYMLQSVGRNFIYRLVKIFLTHIASQLYTFSYLQQTPEFQTEQERGSFVPANFVDKCL
ncbi:hypothetical protein FGF82_23930, partial [Salmonella sp. gx-f9]|nr:hypothetical protein [Salmonella sp. gx-f9]